MKIALFLGAGASVPFEKPTTVQLKEKLLKKYPYVSSPGYLSHFLRLEQFQDIEHVMQSLRDIKNFRNSYGNKFFKHAGYGLYFHRGGDPISLDDFIEKEIKPIEKIIEDDVFVNYAWDYHQDFALLTIYNQIFGILKKESEILNVFTTNYDRAIEQYCSLESNPYRCVDGFKLDSSGTRFLWSNGDFSYFDDKKKENNIYLYKLHGSLNWKLHSKYKLERTTEEQKPADANYSASMLVYPTMSPKDGHELEPFKTIRNHFVNLMKTADACFVIGFSFRDTHINEIFQDFIDLGKPLIAISPNSVEDICTNFLNEEIPDYERKTTVMPSKKYNNIWCVNMEIQSTDAKTPLDLAVTLMKSVLEKSQTKN